jgi:hypothetical protein
MDSPPLLAQPEPLGQEEEIELGSLGGLRQVHKRREIDMATARRIAPHRGVVDAGKVGR